MKELPLNIASQLNKTKIKLNSEITVKSSKQIEFNGITSEYDFIVEAYPEKQTKFYSVYTDYFWTNKEGVNEPTLYLFTSKSSEIINHVAPVSIVNSNYAPRICTFSVNFNEVKPETIKDELEKLFPTKKFNFIKRYISKRHSQ